MQCQCQFDVNNDITSVKVANSQITRTGHRKHYQFIVSHAALLNKKIFKIFRLLLHTDRKSVALQKLSDSLNGLF